MTCFQMEGLQRAEATPDVAVSLAKSSQIVQALVQAVERCTKGLKHVLAGLVKDSTRPVNVAGGQGCWGRCC